MRIQKEKHEKRRNLCRNMCVNENRLEFCLFPNFRQSENERERKSIRFSPTVFYDKFTSHTHWIIYKQSSVPTITGLLL